MRRTPAWIVLAAGLAAACVPQNPQPAQSGAASLTTAESPAQRSQRIQSAAAARGWAVLANSASGDQALLMLHASGGLSPYVSCQGLIGPARMDARVTVRTMRQGATTRSIADTQYIVTPAAGAPIEFSTSRPGRAGSVACAPTGQLESEVVSL